MRKNVGEIETFFRDFLKKFNDLWILKKFWDFQKKVQGFPKKCLGIYEFPKMFSDLRIFKKVQEFPKKFKN